MKKRFLDPRHLRLAVCAAKKNGFGKKNQATSVFTSAHTLLFEMFNLFAASRLSEKRLSVKTFLHAYPTIFSRLFFMGRNGRHGGLGGGEGKGREGRKGERTVYRYFSLASDG